jgi:hypothetical protein
MNLTVNDQEFVVILARLRLLLTALARGEASQVDDILSDAGAITPLTDIWIDALCLRLNAAN